MPYLYGNQRFSSNQRAHAGGLFVQRSLPENQTKENEAELNQPDVNNNVKVCTAFKAGQYAKYLLKWRGITTDRTILQYVKMSE